MVTHTKIRGTLAAAGVVVALLVGSTPAFAGPTTGGGANNLVSAAATAATPTVTRSSVQVVPFSGPMVNSTNVANASSTNCTGCRSVAVAFQAVLVSGQPTVFSPGNVASAVNSACTNCTTFAFAYQDVLQTSGPAYLTPAGQAAVSTVSREVADVAASGADLFTLCNQLSSLAAQLSTALRTPGDVASAGQPVEITTSFSAPMCFQG